MSIGLPLLILAGAFFFLFRSSGMLMRSLGGLARLFNLSEYFVAFIFVSAATSIPELFIGITSASSGIPALSFGDILGANLLNLTLVIGVVTFMQGKLETENAFARKSFWFILFLTFLPLFLGIDGLLSRSDGFAMLIAFSVYMGFVLENREKIATGAASPELPRHTARNLAFFSAAIALLLASSYGITWSAERIATVFLWKLLPFGALFVALGTTLPELAFGIRSALARRGSLAIGNSLGSVAFNSAFIVGVVSIIHPITIAGAGLSATIIGALIGAFILFAIILYRRTLINRAWAFLFVAVYAAYIALEYFV